jgi:hypothetical protein
MDVPMDFMAFMILGMALFQSSIHAFIYFCHCLDFLFLCFHDMVPKVGSNLAYDAKCVINYEVAEQLSCCYCFSWLVLASFHVCHQIHLNHPFSSNTTWMATENGWLDGFYGSLDVMFLLISGLKLATFMDLCKVLDG